jgi:hypothetical protein
LEKRITVDQLGCCNNEIAMLRKEGERSLWKKISLGEARKMSQYQDSAEISQCSNLSECDSTNEENENHFPPVS